MPKPWVYDYIMCVCVFLKEPTNRPKKCVEKTRSSNWWQKIGHVERNDKKIEVYKKRRRGQKNEEKKQKKTSALYQSKTINVKTAIFASNDRYSDAKWIVIILNFLPATN